VFYLLHSHVVNFGQIIYGEEGDVEVWGNGVFV